MKRILWVLALAMLAAGKALAAGGLADITLYDRTEHRVLPVYWHEGKAYVVGKPGNEYQITLKSQARGDLLAIVSVDGVNVVTGETASAAQSGYVIDNWSALDIKGWRKSLAHTAAFYFTDLPDSYAARTGRPDNVGVIGVALFRRKVVEPRPIEPRTSRDNSFEPYSSKAAPQASAPPAVDRAAKAESQARERDKGLGTGHGRNEASEARYVDFERATSTPEETIVIHYDSRANLLARGIVAPEPRHEPQPFPARFVPDPPAWGS